MFYTQAYIWNNFFRNPVISFIKYLFKTNINLVKYNNYFSKYY